MASVAESDGSELALDFKDGDVSVLCKQSPVLEMSFQRGFLVTHAYFVRALATCIDEGVDEHMKLLYEAQFDPVAIGNFARWAVYDGNGAPAETTSDVQKFATAWLSREIRVVQPDQIDSDDTELLLAKEPTGLEYPQFTIPIERLVQERDMDPLTGRGLCSEVTAYAGGFCHAEDIVQLLRLGAIATGSELPGEADGVCRG
ncbi:unnamed protein product [Symbiodinium microadriaticum]|nr:unnamed protein product [Symbiodinium microadriaticum]